MRLRSVASGFNLHGTFETAVPLLWRRSEEIKRKVFRSADERHADDAHHIRDGLPGREVRLDDSGVGEVHTHSGPLVHPLALQLLELSLGARLELRAAFGGAFFPIQNLGNQPRILRRIGGRRRVVRASEAIRGSIRGSLQWTI